MATRYGNVSANDLHERPWVGLETVARFPEESLARRQVPGAEPRIQSLRDGPYAAAGPVVVWNVWTMPQRRTGALWNDPNASSWGGVNSDDAYRLFPVPEPHWLAEASAALARVDDEIAEEELPPVDGATKAEAKRILEALAWRASAPAPTVYPTQDAEIALHFKASGRTGTVVILLRDGGRADCHAYVDGTSLHKHYNTSFDLPDAFVLDLLRRLTSPSQAAVSMPDAGFLQSGTTFLLTNLLRTR